MSAALDRPMTVDEFLAWENEQELRYEFDGVQPIPMDMTGGTAAHEKLAIDLLIFLTTRLAPPWEVYAGGTRIVVAGRVRFPDVLVVAGPLDNDADLASSPVLVAEVLSPSTAVTDRGIKAGEYRSTPSIRHYLMLDQKRPDIVSMSRIADRWTETRAGAGDILHLDAFGLDVPVDVIYRRIVTAPGVPS